MNKDDVPFYEAGQPELYNLQAGNLTVSNWVDAAAECRKQDYNLITLKPFSSEQIKKYAMSNAFRDIGHHQLGDVIFIGLYKTNEVRDVVYRY